MGSTFTDMLPFLSASNFHLSLSPSCKSNCLIMLDGTVVRSESLVLLAFVKDVIRPLGMSPYIISWLYNIFYPFFYPNPSGYLRMMRTQTAVRIVDAMIHLYNKLQVLDYALCITMTTLSFRESNGRMYVYLVKRGSKLSRSPGKPISWYLGPMNEETLSDLVEVVSRLQLRIPSNESGNRLCCPICHTPVSKLGIEGVVASRLLEKIKEMEMKDEDIYKVEEYETLKLVVQSLTK